LGDLEGEDAESSSESLDDSKGEGCLVLSVNVGVLHTQDVLEVISILNYEARLTMETINMFGRCLPCSLFRF